MQSQFFLFVLVVLAEGVRIEDVWGQAPPSDTVLRYEPQPKDKKNLAALPSAESTQLHPRLRQNVAQHKFLDANGRNIQFGFNDCGNASSIIKFLSLVISPDPVVTPGKIKVSFKLEFKQTIADKIRAEVKLTRKLGPVSFTIPCIGSIGSCTYDNICDRLKSFKKCPKFLVEQGFNCKCPFKKRIITMPMMEFTISRNAVPSGTYTAHVTLSHNNAFAGCFELTLTFKKP